VLLELGILWIVRVFRFFLGIQVVEVSEELVETMVSGKKLVLITQVVLPELPCRITEGLEKAGIPTLVSPVRMGDCPVTKAAGLRCSFAANTSR
jgi:hypothetical protein